MKNIGEQIRKIRIQKKMTQAQLGSKIGVSDATINRYEKGLRSPDVETLVKLAETLDISFDQLIGKNENLQPKDIKRLLEKDEYVWEEIDPETGEVYRILLSSDDIRPLRDILRIIARERMYRQKQKVKQSEA